jgi:hypothetical protein
LTLTVAQLTVAGSSWSAVEQFVVLQFAVRLFAAPRGFPADFDCRFEPAGQNCGRLNCPTWLDCRPQTADANSLAPQDDDRDRGSFVAP